MSLHLTFVGYQIWLKSSFHPGSPHLHIFKMTFTGFEGEGGKGRGWKLDLSQIFFFFDVLFKCSPTPLLCVTLVIEFGSFFGWLSLYKFLVMQWVRLRIVLAERKALGMAYSYLSPLKYFWPFFQVWKILTLFIFFTPAYKLTVTKP